jgi:hypothetical protein
MFPFSTTPHRRRRVPLHRLHRLQRPRGIAVVMVLGLLAITIAISYATLRGQGTTTQLARNGGRSLDARAAARSGVAAALRAMSQNGWAGVGTPLSSNVTPNSWYLVTFTTGDTKLTNADPAYSEWPFRVTIESTGFASDPLNTNIQAQYKSCCVVQLLRKNMVSDPANWSSIITQNVYQFSSSDAWVQFPVRINGNSTFLGKLQLCTEYPAAYSGSYTPRDKYLLGLQLRSGTLGDYRPFALGKLYLKGLLTQQDAATVTTMLTVNLATPAVEALVTASPPGHPGAPLTYRLYPGGDVFYATQLGGTLSGQTLAPDVKQNPLGIYCTNGPLSIQGNVQVTGTIITDGSGGSDVTISQANNVLQPYSLPALYGASQLYQLPALIAKSNVTINKAANVQLHGATLCWKTFEVFNNDTTPANSTTLSLTGNLITDTFKQHGRSTWTQTALQWNVDQLAFTGQMATGVPYFPDYEQTQRTFTVKPTLTFSPDSSGVKPHWHDWSQAVYQADPADPGLKWEVVRWDETQQ